MSPQTNVKWISPIHSGSLRLCFRSGKEYFKREARNDKRWHARHTHKQHKIAFSRTEPSTLPLFFFSFNQKSADSFMSLFLRILTEIAGHQLVSQVKRENDEIKLQDKRAIIVMNAIHQLSVFRRLLPCECANKIAKRRTIQLQCDNFSVFSFCLLWRWQVEWQRKTKTPNIRHSMEIYLCYHCVVCFIQFWNCKFHVQLISGFLLVSFVFIQITLLSIEMETEHDQLLVTW